MTWACSARAARRAPDVERGAAADARVDLVEDERGRAAEAVARRAARADDLEREHDPGELAAGRRAGHAARRGARVGGEQDLDVVDAVPREPDPLPVGQRDAVGVGPAAELDLDDGLAHGQVRQLLGHPDAEVVAGRPARVGQGERGARRARPRAAATSAPRRSTRSSAVTSSSSRAAPRPDHSSTSSTVSPYFRVSTPRAARRSCT